MKLFSALYAAVVFLSAFLLFLLEPIAARRILPVFGGSASVWTTCLVFFQAALLAGYCYAHIVARHLESKWQSYVHVLLLIAAILALNAHFTPDTEAVIWRPIWSILRTLSATIGIPFLALAATTPLLQTWYQRAGGTQAGEPPWWFFAVSNTGSLLALIAYPLAVEPHLTLRAQSWLWVAGFFLFAVLCGAIALQRRRQIHFRNVPADSSPAAATIAAPKLRDKLLWILLPACGSMLLCAVTSHLSQNIAAIPLLWILPLAAYLLSFIVAFASPRSYPRFIAVRMLALSLAVFAYLLYYSRTAVPLQVAIPVCIAALFFSCLFCHGEVYRLRPGAGAATQFYLLLSLGSTLGAIFVGVVSPNVFHANYDLVISLILLSVLAIAATWEQGVTAVLVWSAATICVAYIAVEQARVLREGTIAQVRSFYGSLRVTEGHIPPEAETTRTLYHGTIQHGTQMFGNGLETVPTTYFARDSGAGLAIEACCDGRQATIGIIGLGAGTLAAYGRPGDKFTFYEIDPLVERLARALFTYLRSSPAAVRVELGDARLSLAREKAPQQYDVLVLDAFTGDAVPVHLLTAQAMALYLRHLRPDGVLAFHISSQYIDLAPEIALEAQQAGLHTLMVHSAARESQGEFTADWVLVSPDAAALAKPSIANAAEAIPQRQGLRLWTDDYSSLLPLIKWRKAQGASSSQDSVR